MHPIIEKHGKQLISELLDIIFIHEGQLKRSEAIDFLVRHKIVTRATKYMNVRLWKERVEHEYVRVEGRFGGVRTPLEVPYTRYRIYFSNGQNINKLQVEFKDTDLPQIMEELQNETNETSEHG